MFAGLGMWALNRLIADGPLVISGGRRPLPPRSAAARLFKRRDHACKLPARRETVQTLGWTPTERLVALLALAFEGRRYRDAGRASPGERGFDQRFHQTVLSVAPGFRKAMR